MLLGVKLLAAVILRFSIPIIIIPALTWISTFINVQNKPIPNLPPQNDHTSPRAPTEGNEYKQSVCQESIEPRYHSHAFNYSTDNFVQGEKTQIQQ